MFNLLKQYAPLIIGAQFVALLLLGYLLYGSYTQWEVEETVVRDTTVQVEKDTVWGGFDFEFSLEDLEPAETITETRRDTVVKDSIVYVTETPGIDLYEESFSRTLTTGGTVTGTITSRVRGTLMDQRVSLSASLPTITEYKTKTITEETTRTQIGKWRVVGSGTAFFSGDGVEVIAPGIGVQRPTEFSVYYHYDFKNGFHGGTINFPLSLLL